MFDSVLKSLKVNADAVLFYDFPFNEDYFCYIPGRNDLNYKAKHFIRGRFFKYIVCNYTILNGGIYYTTKQKLKIKSLMGNDTKVFVLVPKEKELNGLKVTLSLEGYNLCEMEL